MPLFHTANRSKQTGQPQQAKQASTQRPTTSVPHPLQLRQMPTDPQSILQLQQLYGNRAVGRMMSAQSATPMQRMEEAEATPDVSVTVGDHKAPLPGNAKKPIQRVSASVTVSYDDVVTGVTVSKSRTSTGRSGGQGSHNTAYITFVDMVKLRVHGEKVDKAAQNLLDCYNELCNFPGDSIKNPKYIDAKTNALFSCNDAVKKPGKGTIQNAIIALLEMRNKMPLTRTDDGKKTVGNEQYH
ncbi:MAG: hypothetical protein ACXVDE_08355, partial [Tumebacillaceae bacterium]